MEAAIRVRRAVRSSFCCRFVWESELDCSITSANIRLKSRSLQADRGGLYRKYLRTKGFHFKTVAVQLLCDAERRPPSAMGFSSTRRGMSNLWRMHVLHLPVF
jgi:hypothetical protein